jgi:hypothetical protein
MREGDNRATDVFPAAYKWGAIFAVINSQWTAKAQAGLFASPAGT